MQKPQASAWYVWPSSLSVWYLGAMVIQMNSDCQYRYLLLSIYLIATGLFDTFFYDRVLDGIQLFRSWPWMLEAGTKTILGFVLLLQSLLSLLIGINPSLYVLGNLLVVTMMMMKLIRFYLLSHRDLLQTR